MYAFGTIGLHRGVSAVVAAAIVSVSGLAADKQLRATTFGGNATLAASDVLPGVVMLPEVIVIAPRIEPLKVKHGAG
jgi:hypothetical protein